MKSCSCGTYTEQQRFKMGWLTATETRALAKTSPSIINCAHCDHSEITKAHTLKCLYVAGGISTSAGAACNAAESTVF
ncbi:hypothetical protein [Propionivibrio sp.]|uniref:hypothetical protein n=1 Tax=Propionivibrio sp. TaxID=2212460 RepID=UPI003BF37773